jgi:TP901-1 family phage major tail protein
MTAQAGKDLLVKIDDGTGSGTFITVAGLQLRQMTFNAAAIDITDQDSVGRWRELLAGAGPRHATIAGSGVFRDAASDALMQQLFFQSGVAAFQLIVPSFGVIQGPFLVTSLIYKGDHQGEMKFDMTLESAGALAFTAISSP